jgi:hypothetical protein
MNEPNALDPRAEKGFQFAADVSKQVLSLSSGLLALSVTFAKPILEGAGSGSIRVLVVTWSALALSILLGVLTLMKMTGEIASPRNPSPTVYGGAVRALSALQLLAFLVGAIGTFLFGLTRL